MILRIGLALQRLRLFFFVAAFLSLSGCEGKFSYTAAPMEAWVVDAETGKPIEGAVVVAHWQLVVGGFDGPHDRGQLEVLETVTDSKGRFHFDGFTKRNPMLYELRNQDPRIVIFKPGYESAILSNQYPKPWVKNENDENPYPYPGRNRVSDYNGEIIKLKKLKVTVFRDIKQYYSLQNFVLEKLIEDCQWEKIPRMIVAMDQEKKRITALDPNADVRLISIDKVTRLSSPSCGSPEEFFKGYSK